MQYRGRDFLYDDETSEEAPETVQELPADKEFRRKRSIRAKRRSAKKPANRPGCGIGARRNNRWTW